MANKPKIVYREKYYNGTVVNKSEIQRLANENIDKITTEIKIENHCLQPVIIYARRASFSDSDNRPTPIS